MAIRQDSETKQWLVICEISKKIVQIHDDKETALKNDFLFDVGMLVNKHNFVYDPMIRKSIRTDEILRKGIIVGRGRFGVHRDGSPLYIVEFPDGTNNSVNQKFITAASGAGGD